MKIKNIKRFIKFKYPVLYNTLKHFKKLLLKLTIKIILNIPILKRYKLGCNHNKKKRIFYLSPDTNVPTGGIRVFYLHAETLTKEGTPAFVVHSEGNFRCNWFSSDAVIISFFRMLWYFNRKKDILVIPEIFIGYIELFEDIRNKYIFVQNFGCLDISLALRYKDKIRFITCGQYITNKLKNDLGIESKIIYTPVDKIFKTDKKIRNKKRIMYLARKNFNDVLYLENKILQEFPEYKFIGIKNIPSRKDLVKEYQKSNIFLTVSYPEGFPFPPIEAMLCGCLVVGYTGGGGSEFMIDNKTAFIAEDGNIDELYKKLKKAITLSDNESEKIRQNAIKKAKGYDYEKFLFTLNLVYKFRAGNIE